MPQKDKYKDRVVQIEFQSNDSLSTRTQDRMSVILVTNGSFECTLNQIDRTVSAPSLICLSSSDQFELKKSPHIFSAQSFHFHPEILQTAYFSDTLDYQTLDLKIDIGLSLFEESNSDNRITVLTEELYTQIREWFFIIGTEVHAQSDSIWVCRIKKYLIQILSVIEKLSQSNMDDPLQLALDFIYSNYQNKITQDDISRSAHLNRVSLNKLFNDRFSCTAIQYLLMYRIQISKELLIHTGLSLYDIAYATGFQYDTYFIRQFTKIQKMSPTQFRIQARTSLS